MTSAIRAAILAIVVLPALRAAELEIDGKLLQATPGPEPREVAPYPRALCTFLYEVQRVHAGSYEGERILVVKWAVWDRKKLAGLPEQDGAVERLRLERWDAYPEYKRQRIVDEIREVDLAIYYDPASRPDDAPLGELLAAREGEMAAGVVRGATDGWLFLADELHHAATGRFWEMAWEEVSLARVSPLPAMRDFQARLSALGVNLLMVPVPPKVSIYPEHFHAEARVTPLADYVRELEEAGLPVLDLEPVFLAFRGHRPDAKLYCAQDSHWTPEACGLAAEEILKRLDLPRAEQMPAGAKLVRGEVIEIRGDLARMLAGVEMPPESLTVDRLSSDGARKRPELSAPEAEIVLLGDSHVTVFSEGSEELHGAGAGLPDHLRRRGLRADVVASHGDGVNQARVNLYRERSARPELPDYWKNKKWVVWVFAAREFTRARSWSAKIPLE